MRVSVIVSVYKDVEALALIIEALKRQTYKNFEVVIVEDGELDQMSEFIKRVEGLDLKHTTQKDQGVRKARSQNNGLLASRGEYLIFIDGDCIPHSRFVEGHVRLSAKNRVLSGRRMNIPIETVKKIRNNEIDILDIEKNLWRYSLWIFDKNVRFRQAIYIDPDSILYKIIAKRTAATSILGCNFSCYKEPMIKMNGFDESYAETAIPDDMDWEWRFLAYGLELVSCKNVANMFHLDHKIHDRGDATPYIKIMNERKARGEYVCKEGLNTHNV